MLLLPCVSQLVEMSTNHFSVEIEKCMSKGYVCTSERANKHLNVGRSRITTTTSKISVQQIDVLMYLAFKLLLKNQVYTLTTIK
jgi:hypothetical protein